MKLLNPFEELSQQLVRIENSLSEIKKSKPSDERKIQYLTRKETSKMLSVSMPTLGEWTKKGYIPAVRIGTNVRYLKEDVVDALKKVNTLKYRRDS